MNINEITAGMTPQEKEIYFSHQEMRHKQEAEKIDLEREQLKAYKEKLIEDILKDNKNLTYEELKRMSIRTLERIW